MFTRVRLPTLQHALAYNPAAFRSASLICSCQPDILDAIVDRGAPIVANRTLAIFRRLCRPVFPEVRNEIAVEAQASRFVVYRTRSRLCSAAGALILSHGDTVMISVPIAQEAAVTILGALPHIGDRCSTDLLRPRSVRPTHAPKAKGAPGETQPIACHASEAGCLAPAGPARNRVRGGSSS